MESRKKCILLFIFDVRSGLTFHNFFTLNMEENNNLSAEEKWFEKLSDLRMYLELNNKLPSPCSQLGRWLSYQNKAVCPNIDRCRGLLQVPLVYEAFDSLRQEFPHLFMSEKEQWENSFFYKILCGLLGL